MSNGCVFCQIVLGKAPATKVFETGVTLGIVPLNPIIEGHVIFMPKHHVADAKEDPLRTADTMRDAAIHARDKLRGVNCNLITSVGAAATQSVRHLHIHVVPRYRDDGLMLPWGSNESHMRENDEMAYEFYNGSGEE